MVSQFPDSDRTLREALEGVKSRMLTPALVVDLSAADHNIAAILRRIDASRARWRPHIKTVKQVALVRALAASGIRRFKCATLPELRLLDALARENTTGAAVDVLWAYPSTREARDALARLPLHANTHVSLLADSPAHLEALCQWAPTSGRSWGVFLDVDVGMRRTGSPPTRWATQCGPGVPSLPDDLSFRGLHGYDGHHRSHERSAAHTSYDSLVQLARTLELQPAHTVITSGTHSYEHALVHGGLSEGPWQQEVSPGTIVLSDLRSAHAADALSLRQAVFVASRVVSVGEGRVTLDAGSKALNPDVRPPHCALLGWPELEVGSPSEEHLPVWGPTDAMPALGELVWIVPAHACTTVNLYQEALYVRDGTYAGAGTIDAAGHPLWIEGHRE